MEMDFSDIAIPTFVTDLSSDASGGWFELLGKGTGVFQQATALPFSSYLPMSLGTGDFNNDGQLDLVALLVDPSGNPSLSFSEGKNGIFQAPFAIPVPGTIGSLILTADVNGDGNLDVIVTASSLVTNLPALFGNPALGASSVTVFLGDGKGGFKNSFTANEGSYMSGAVLANFFGTGNLDLVQSMIMVNVLGSDPPTGAIEIRPGHGDGTFGSPITLAFPTSTIPTDIAVADFDGDGRPDIAIAAVPAQPLGAIPATTDLSQILSAVLDSFPTGAADVLLNLTVAPTLPTLTSGTLANGATYVAGGLVPGSWAQVKGSHLATVTNYIWQSADFAGLGNNLPTVLKGTSVKVNGLPAAVYYVDPSQINFQVPSGVSGTASVQVTVNGVSGNTITAASAGSSPGIFPVTVNGVNYAGGVFTDGKIIGDPSVTSAFRNARPGDVVQLYATGLVTTPSGVVPVQQGVSGVTVTIGTMTFPADFAGLVAVGEFQINFTVPQQFANLPAGSYPITITVNGVSSPSTINSMPPGQLVIPISH